MQKVSKRGLASGKVPTSDPLAGVAGVHSRLSGQDGCPAAPGQLLPPPSRAPWPGMKGSAVTLLQGATAEARKQVGAPVLPSP